MGSIHICPSYVTRGRACVNSNGQPHKDFAYIIEDTHTQVFIDGGEYPILGGWKAEIARGFKGYCNDCVEGRSEPMTASEKLEFLDGYLGEYERWEGEREKRRKLAMEQERLLERIRREKRDSEAWTEAD